MCVMTAAIAVWNRQDGSKVVSVIFLGIGARRPCFGQSFPAGIVLECQVLGRSPSSIIVAPKTESPK